MAEAQATEKPEQEPSEEERAAAEGETGGEGDEELGEADDGDAAAGQATRILNQDEIDSLLGFDDHASLDSGGSSLQAIVNSALVSYERLPMLEVVFDRVVRMMSTSLRHFTSDNVEVSLDNIHSVRFGDYLNGIPLPAMLAVMKAEEWDNYGLLTVDSALIYSIVDVLLGGRKGAPTMRIEGRPYTTIERTLVERMINVVLSDLTTAFDPLSPVTFRFDRLETNPRFATIVRAANAAIVARFRIDMEERGGRLDLVLPYATLEPVRELLLQMFMGEKFGRDSIWEIHLASELWRTDVEIEAVLGEKEVSLSEILNWEVGSRMLLQATPDSEVRLRCGALSMFGGRVGRKGPNIAVQIERAWTEHESEGEG